DRGERTRPLGRDQLCGPGDQPVFLFLLDFIVVVSRSSVARRLFDDVADGLLEYAHPDHGSRSTARPRHVRLFDDVHGYGPLRSFLWRSAGPPHRRADNGCHRRCGLRPGRDLVRTSAPRTPHRSPPPNHRPGPGRRRTGAGIECATGRRVSQKAQLHYYPAGKEKLDGGDKGRSELDVSNNTFQAPSRCFFHTIRYFPLSEIVLPDASLKLISYLPLV